MDFDNDDNYNMEDNYDLPYADNSNRPHALNRPYVLPYVDDNDYIEEIYDIPDTPTTIPYIDLPINIYEPNRQNNPFDLNESHIPFAPISPDIPFDPNESDIPFAPTSPIYGNFDVDEYEREREQARNRIEELKNYIKDIDDNKAKYIRQLKSMNDPLYRSILATLNKKRDEFQREIWDIEYSVFHTL